MPLIIEDGSGSNQSANSYGDVAGLRAYAEGRGVDLSDLTDKEVSVFMIKAMDYLEAQRGRYKGHKTNAAQPLQWPRSDVWDVDLPGKLLGSTEIPRELEYAQYALAIDARDQDLQPNRLPSDKGAVIREKVEGAIEVVYAERKQHFTPAFAKPDALLAPLYKNRGLSVIRA